LVQKSGVTKILGILGGGIVYARRTMEILGLMKEGTTLKKLDVFPWFTGDCGFGLMHTSKKNKSPDYIYAAILKNTKDGGREILNTKPFRSNFLTGNNPLRFAALGLVPICADYFIRFELLDGVYIFDNTWCYVPRTGIVGAVENKKTLSVETCDINAETEAEEACMTLIENCYQDNSLQHDKVQDYTDIYDSLAADLIPSPIKQSQGATLETTTSESNVISSPIKQSRGALLETSRVFYSPDQPGEQCIQPTNPKAVNKRCPYVAMETSVRCTVHELKFQKQIQIMTNFDDDGFMIINPDFKLDLKCENCVRNGRTYSFCRQVNMHDAPNAVYPKGKQAEFRGIGMRCMGFQGSLKRGNVSACKHKCIDGKNYCYNLQCMRAVESPVSIPALVLTPVSAVSNSSISTAVSNSSISTVLARNSVPTPYFPEDYNSPINLPTPRVLEKKKGKGKWRPSTVDPPNSFRAKLSTPASKPKNWLGGSNSSVTVKSNTNISATMGFPENWTVLDKGYNHYKIISPCKTVFKSLKSAREFISKNDTKQLSITGFF